jgi:hypothetical protein
MHLYCPTDEAIFLLGCRDSRGVFRFPTNAGALPGLHFKVRPLESINTQLVNTAGQHVSVEGLGGKITIEQNFSAPCQLPSGQLLTVYCGILNLRDDEISSSWLTMSDMIRGLMKDPNRVVYMKALQVFSGALESSVRAVVPDHLQEGPDDLH